MATSAQQIDVDRASRLNSFRVALTTALAATIFLLLCWIGASIGFGPATHMYIQLFSGAEPASGLALIVGLCWSLVGGLVAGGLFAFIYNLLAPLER